MQGDTELVLTGIGIPRFAARGITEDFAPLDLGELRRNINGTLVDLTDSALHRKYTLTLSGNDAYPLPLDGIWRGKEVTIECTTVLGAPATFANGVANVVLGRDAASGSGYAQFGERFTTNVIFTTASDGTVTATANFADVDVDGAGFIFYRPVLECMVQRWSMNRPEYEGLHPWTLELEEI